METPWAPRLSSLYLPTNALFCDVISFKTESLLRLLRVESRRRFWISDSWFMKHDPKLRCLSPCLSSSAGIVAYCLILRYRRNRREAYLAEQCFSLWMVRDYFNLLQFQYSRIDDYFLDNCYLTWHSYELPVRSPSLDADEANCHLLRIHLPQRQLRYPS